MQSHEAHLENERECYIKIKTIFNNIIKDRRQSKGFVSLGTRKRWKKEENIDALYDKPQLTSMFLVIEE